MITEKQLAARHASCYQRVWSSAMKMASKEKKANNNHAATAYIAQSRRRASLNIIMAHRAHRA